LRERLPDEEIDPPLVLGQGTDDFAVQGEIVAPGEAQAEGRTEARVLVEKGARYVFDCKPLAGGADPGVEIGMLRGADLHRVAEQEGHPCGGTQSFGAVG
jgi:hypothetical protein